MDFFFGGGWGGVGEDKSWDPQIHLEKSNHNLMRRKDFTPHCSSHRTPFLRHCFKRWETPSTTWEHYSSITCIAFLSL